MGNKIVSWFKRAYTNRENWKKERDKDLLRATMFRAKTTKIASSLFFYQRPFPCTFHDRSMLVSFFRRQPPMNRFANFEITRPRHSTWRYFLTRSYSLLNIAWVVAPQKTAFAKLRYLFHGATWNVSLDTSFRRISRFEKRFKG